MTTPTSPRTLLACSLLFTVAACGAEDAKNKSCILSYEKASEVASGEANLELTYRATMSNECKSVYSENSGRSTITLAITSKGSEGAYALGLKVGERSFALGDKYSLKEGNLQTSFSSDTLKDWAFPWVDSPGTASVTVIVPKAADKATWPTAVTTEFAADAK